MAMICQKCKIGTLYVISTNKDKSIKIVRCKFCKKDFDFKKLLRR
jgi:hypothetical protein